MDDESSSPQREGVPVLSSSLIEAAEERKSGRGVVDFVTDTCSHLRNVLMLQLQVEYSGNRYCF